MLNGLAEELRLSDGRVVEVNADPKRRAACVKPSPVGPQRIPPRHGLADLALSDR